MLSNSSTGKCLRSTDQWYWLLFIFSDTKCLYESAILLLLWLLVSPAIWLSAMEKHVYVQTPHLNRFAVPPSLELRCWLIEVREEMARAPSFSGPAFLLSCFSSQFLSLLDVHILLLLHGFLILGYNELFKRNLMFHPESLGTSLRSSHIGSWQMKTQACTKAK